MTLTLAITLTHWRCRRYQCQRFKERGAKDSNKEGSEIPIYIFEQRESNQNGLSMWNDVVFYYRLDIIQMHI